MSHADEDPAELILKLLQRISTLEVQLNDICTPKHDYIPTQLSGDLFTPENELVCTRCGKKTKQIPF